MSNTKINEILDFAISDEKRFQEIYSSAALKASDQSLVSLLKDLAVMEKGHEEKLKAFKAGKIEKINTAKVQDLKLSDYLADVEINESSSLQEIMVYAMKSEKKASDLYSDLAGTCDTPLEKKLFLDLAQEEGQHKNDLEKVYDDIFMSEN